MSSSERPRDRAEPVAVTAAGKVRGSWVGDAAVFLGIPYATAPEGEGRFAPPSPAEPWAGTRPALTYGATALQPRQELTLIPEPLVDGDNCLNLNVFTPELGRAGRPVLVWIHGGGFFAGCNASPWYWGERFARDGVVLVSINYRLGVEGFLHVEDGGVNRGVLDWLAALGWVQDNIARFGGDPANVTVAGQSAGGVAAVVLLTMPRAHGLFRRVLCMSGPVGLVGTLEHAQATSQVLAERVGCRLDRRTLAELPTDQLLGLQAGLMPATGSAPVDPEAFAARLEGGPLPLGPCVDGDIVPEAPLPAITAGTGSACDLLAGTTTEEFNVAFSLAADAIDRPAADRALRGAGLSPEGVLAYRQALGDPPPAGLLGQALTDCMFRLPTGQLGEARSRSAGRTYLYEWAWQSPALGGALGAGHCVDVPFAFANLDAPGVDGVLGPNPPQGLATLVHQAWVRFVTDGDPGWLSYRAEVRPTMVFDDESALVEDPQAPLRAIWAAARPRVGRP